MKKLNICLLGIFTIVTSFAFKVNASEVAISLDQNDQGELVASEMMDFHGKSRDEIFARALSVARDYINGENDNIDKADFDSRSIVFVKTLDNGKGGGKIIDKDNAVFRFTATLKPNSDGEMLFSIDDMWVTYKDKGIFQKTVPLSSLKDDNQKHKDLKKEFLNLLTAFMEEYIDTMNAVDYQPVTHWNELASGKVVKGMNEFEVKLLKGNPRNISANGSRHKWMYSNSNVIVITDGKVTSIVE